MGLSNSGSGLIGSIINTAANVGMGIYNRQQENQNNILNRQHAFQMQNFMMSQNRANAMSVMQYNNPYEQRKRLESAGVNPFSAVGMIDAGNGEMPSPANVSPHAGVYTPVNIDFSGIANALLRLDEMKFTKGENDANRRATEANLWKTLANASMIQREQMSNSLIMQANDQQARQREQMVQGVLQQDLQNSQHEHNRSMRLLDEEIENRKPPVIDTPFFKGTTKQFEEFFKDNVSPVLEGSEKKIDKVMIEKLIPMLEEGKTKLQKGMYELLKNILQFMQ